MGKEQNKRMHVTTCKNCNERLDISESGAVQKLIVQVKSLKEHLTGCLKKCNYIRTTKNGELQRLQLILSLILKDLCEEDKIKAYQKVKDMRAQIPLKMLEEKYGNK